ncbi:HNH endonuclease [Klenkia brasiliensis]|uniref:HNH nuclease domain-containing protein n=1 Tax=Klenkia brasiliensis TaxID=333142 RepID=A0A1G7YGV7_9ACTN|nr:hypothetical protein [Klenkia brasiliensis]SDG95713.1 hypothetical protein SAMN05660324_3954 [Klenkia brasiliensis]
MAWLRIGDTSTIHPLRLALHDPANPLVARAAWGVFLDLATLCAAEGTYDVAPGFMHLAGGTEAPDLIRRLHRAGLLVHTAGTGRHRTYKIVDDRPELIHIRLRTEIDWEKKRRQDTGDPRLKAAVLLRDGDACRWCGRVVQPNDNRSPRGRELDHLRPGDAARTPDDLVVACKVCNGARGKAWQDTETRGQLAELFRLLPPPTERIYVQSTATWLVEQGHPLPPGSRVVARADHTAPTTSRAPRAGSDPTHPATAGVANGPTTPSDDQHPATAGVATPDGPDGRAHPGNQPGVAPPSPTSTPHPGTQPGVAPPAGATQHDAPDRPTADRSVTDRSGGAGPGRVGSGSGAGRVAGPPSRLAPDPPRTDSTTTPPTAPRSRRGRRRSRPGGDQR